MWIVKIALERPLTFIVLALLLLILGPLAILRTPTDIFPNIDIPVVSVVWQYTGLPAQDMNNRIVTGFERSLTTTVNDVEHTETQSLNGVGLVKVFFQPNVKVDMAVAQVTAISQTVLKSMPQGVTPPLVLVYNASTVPVLQFALSSKELSETTIFDDANQIVRTFVTSVRGAATPYPYGGKQRQVQVDINPQALLAHGLSPSDVVTAIGNQNLILPAGTEKIGDTEYSVVLNGSPQQIDELNNAPIKTVNGITTYIRDVAHVHDGSPPQTNIVRVNGQRAVLMSILKIGDASTLDIVDSLQGMLPAIRAAIPQNLEIHSLSDQSLFVRAAISGVIREGVIAASLTGMMILLFLGSWRSTLIIAISIPLSILASIISLSALGETINIMTLGGLALAVGILVDDATVTIENINSHLEEGKEVYDAIMEGAHQIAVPAFVSTLSICIVFVPIFFLGGVAKYLFAPLAEAVVFAMMASYVLSRTLVPTLSLYWLKKHEHDAQPSGPFGHFQRGFEKRFERMRNGYRGALETTERHRGLFAILFFASCALSIALLVPWLGRDFFPYVDGGQIKLHFRAPTGLRIEETARLADGIEDVIHQTIPKQELSSIVDTLGLPYSGINLSYSNTGVIGTSDGDIFVTLNEDHHPTIDYVRSLRAQLRQKYPSVVFSFLPADIVGQILNFGAPAPIDVQVSSHDPNASAKVAKELYGDLLNVPGLVDLRIQQALNLPQINVNVDRTRASLVGLTTNDVASNLLTALAGSTQVNPTFWVDPRTGISYSIATQAPQYRIDTLQELKNLPITSTSSVASSSSSGGAASQILENLASFSRSDGPAVMTHYSTRPTMDLFGSVDKTDLGSVARDVQKIVDEHSKHLPRDVNIDIRGQVQTMQASYKGLLGGLLFAILLVYLLIVVNFQSWLDPLIIIAALPAALAGLVWMLFLTGTPLSVPALMGAIMCMGVATANSILVISFARERLAHHDDPVRAAIEAGFQRFRPVLMTALAMIIGMVPMALGLGEGGEQNAPLGRAVIGGLLLATAATLFFVPTFFSLMHRSHKADRHAATA
ncbi:efflux RND transporter permease subunit [Dyella caseinilytica]|uniref:Efflux RND transporter permease subunit n=1 Tax=Dyella caseinilytica TaxID=1849581 RepID=A0ABX7GQB4_9GAMM|nr:efflux RND transporter permease subunit [Dyella caseinilytica]QRN52624.1 efflux RND transporter permease subunit [Dyella caseinilytica]GGA07460.1 RND transporter [Dyella caseinilytica]